MNTQAEIIVVAVLLTGNDNSVSFFIAERADGAGWEFPGGKVEKGESKREALIRELQEELSIHVSVGKFVAQSSVVVGQKRIVMDLFHGVIISGELQLNEHIDGRWISSDEIGDFRWAPADIPLLDFVRAHFQSFDPEGEQL